MTDTTPTSKRSLFEAVVDLPEGERTAYLDAHCPDDGTRRAVNALLALDEDSADDFLRSPVTRPDTSQADAPLPEAIGRYRVTGRIGAGGMGVVYEGAQESPQRAVAIKVVRAEMVSERVLSRFRNEAEILGRLDHPGIARIYEAGTARANGYGERPFFAMELVRGTPLLTYARDRETTDRLRLFADVCDAVHHAHQKGVIHRDLKPANILVTDDGQVKVLDFGVARATDADIQAVTVQTDIGQLIGTVPYMSPEQVLGDASRLDTRSDVYALGVLLFELLTGTLPLDVREQSIPEAARIIRDEDSTRLSAVVPALRGDLEWIVAKALEKDADRRYDSASAFAADVRRHLAHEPVLAGPPSAAYRVRKFIRRNRTGVAWGAVAALLLVAGVGATIGQSIRATQAERDSRTALADWRREADRARIGSDFLIMALGDARVAAIDGSEPTLREAIDLASARIDERFGNDPRVEAVARRLLARIYFYVEAHELAVEQYLDAHRLLTPAMRTRFDSLAMTEVLFGLQGAVRELAPPNHENTCATWYVLELLPLLESIVDDAHPDLAAAMRDMRRALVVTDEACDAALRELRAALDAAPDDSVATELRVRGALEVAYTPAPADELLRAQLDRVLAVHATVPRDVDVHRSLGVYLLLVAAHTGNRHGIVQVGYPQAVVAVTAHEDRHGVANFVGIALWMEASVLAPMGEEERRVTTARRLVDEAFTHPGWLDDDARTLLGAALMQRGRDADRDAIAQHLVAGSRSLRQRNAGGTSGHRMLESRRARALLRLAAIHASPRLEPLPNDVAHLADQPAILGELSEGIDALEAPMIAPVLAGIAHSMAARTNRSDQWYAVARQARTRAALLRTAAP